MYSNQPNDYSPDQYSLLKSWSGLILFAIPALLFIPVLYYSLTTPFALVDDYGMCYYVEFLDNSKRFINWFNKQVVNFNYGRYRPFFDLYNMVTWKIFGPNPWLHHLARWMLHFGAVFSFSAAYLSFSRNKQTDYYEAPGGESTKYQLLPLAILVYVWLFFPNSPASRLGPQEVYTVFFLGLCNWMIALLILMENKQPRPSSTVLKYVVLYIAYLGLSISKEVNISIMLWILVFNYILLFRGISWKIIFGGLPLILIFLFTLEKIYIASHSSHYGVAPVTLEFIMKNSVWLYRELLQIKTSPYITIGFLILISSLLLWIIVRIVKRDLSSEFLFILFLLGQFASFYIILCTSWAQVLRYWYIILPLFSTLLAFGAKFILKTASQQTGLTKYPAIIILSCFLVFFIGCNYYNFLLQTIAQHSLRHAESKLISEISLLHDQGQYIQILKSKKDPEAELVSHLIAYYRRFSPRFYGKEYKIHTTQPPDTEQSHYIVTMHKQPGNLKIHMTITGQEEYRLLSYAYNISGLLQQKRPYLSKDAGVHLLGKYQWIIYKTIR